MEWPLELISLEPFRSPMGKLRPRAGKAHPQCPSESEMSQNQIPCVPVTIFIAW